MERWTTKSSRATQLAMAVGSLIVGVLLMYLCRDYGTVGSDTFAGLLLGLSLAVIGAAGVVATARQTVVIDSLTRTITVEDRRLWGTASLATPGTAPSAVPSDSPTVWDPLPR